MATDVIIPFGIVLGRRILIISCTMNEEEEMDK